MLWFVYYAYHSMYARGIGRIRRNIEVLGLSLAGDWDELDLEGEVARAAAGGEGDRFAGLV